ncbi:MAG: FHA domain-containing protein [Actinobacteria bacterium]|nr:FHA domain-containing protein [Actinomycetota bacterium]
MHHRRARHERESRTCPTSPPPHRLDLRDLGSTNGTKLNGVRVEGEQMLATGDVIMLGAIKATFEIS